MSNLDKYIDKSYTVDYNEGMKETLDRWGKKLRAIFTPKPHIKKSTDGKVIKPLEIDNEQV